MYVLGIAILGIFIGAAGAEILRCTKPDLLCKIEQKVKSFVNPEPPADGGEESDSEEN